MPFYVVYARTVNEHGQEVSIPPGTIERMIVEHPGLDHEAMIEIQNSRILTPGTDYGIRLLQPKNASAIVCVQRKPLPDGVDIGGEGGDGDFDLLGSGEDGDDEKEDDIL